MWLVGGGSGPWGCGNTDTPISGIECNVEAFQESITQDEVEIICISSVDGFDNKVDVVVATFDQAIESTRPDLGVRCERISILW